MKSTIETECLRCGKPINKGDEVIRRSRSWGPSYLQHVKCKSKLPNPLYQPAA